MRIYNIQIIIRSVFRVARSAKMVGKIDSQGIVLAVVSKTTLCLAMGNLIKHALEFL
jgi:hypothetical membrane protein